MSRYHTPFTAAAALTDVKGPQPPDLLKRPQLVPGDVVHAMRSMGWDTSSQLLDAWLSRPRGEISDGEPAGQVESGIVRMGWVLELEKAQEARTELSARALDGTGVRTLQQRLKAAGWAGGAFRFGARDMPARELDALGRLAERPLNGATNLFDGPFGVIGRATMHAAAVGAVELDGQGRPHFIVEALGLYLRDSYDFTDHGPVTQSLGVWSRHRCLNRAQSAEYLSSAFSRHMRFRDFTPLTKRAFRDWSRKTGLGGDFIVYSDVTWLRPTQLDIAL